MELGKEKRGAVRAGSYMKTLIDEAGGKNSQNWKQSKKKKGEVPWRIVIELDN